MNVVSDSFSANDPNVEHDSTLPELASSENINQLFTDTKDSKNTKQNRTPKITKKYA